MSVEGLQNVELTDETKEETKEEKEVATKVPEAAEKYVGWDAWIHYEKTRDYRRHYVWGKGDAVGVYGRAKYVGYRVLDAMDFGGEVLCDFFGITSSKFQYEIDAGKRMLERVCVLFDQCVLCCHVCLIVSSSSFVSGKLLQLPIISLFYFGVIITCL